MNIKDLSKIRKIAINFRKEYKDFSHYNKKNPLDELIFIICSIKRCEARYLLAFKSLKKKFPRHENLAQASQEQICEIFAPYGLQNEKAFAIKENLKIMISCFGKPTLNPLKKMSDAECESFLLNLYGVGRKVARCVMMYSLSRLVFPVDSNCWRISRRLGLVDWPHNKKVITPKDMDLLQCKIPLKSRFSLHVNMVSHGRMVCSDRNPKCHRCIIRKYCLKAVNLKVIKPKLLPANNIN